MNLGCGEHAEAEGFGDVGDDVGLVMPAGIREDVGHDLGGSRIESGKKDPGLEGEDGGDHRQQNDAAAGADNLQAQHEQPGEDEADPFDPVEHVEDETADAQGLLQFHIRRFELQGCFDEADGADETEPEKGDDKSIESKAPHKPEVCRFPAQGSSGIHIPSVSAAQMKGARPLLAAMHR